MNKIREIFSYNGTHSLDNEIPKCISDVYQMHAHATLVATVNAYVLWSRLMLRNAHEGEQLFLGDPKTYAVSMKINISET